MDKKELMFKLNKFLSVDLIKTLEVILLNRTRHFKVAVENLFQSHNASTVMRNCNCFGNNSQDCIDIIKSQRFQIITTTSRTNDVLLPDFDVSKKSAFFF